MAFCGVEFFGESIEKMSGMNVLLPEGEGPWPVLYLLHGLSDNHTVWCRRTSIERYVAELPLIVVMIRNLSQAEYDCFALAERLAAQGPRIALRLDCGKDDFLLRSNRQFHAHLSALGVPHVYHEHDGDHNWDYWDAHITETLDFVMRHVGRDPSSASNRSLSSTPPAAENPPDRPSE